MRGLNSGSNNGNSGNSGKGSGGMTTAQQLQVLKVGAEVVKGVLNIRSEIEKTKQLAINAQVQMHESDNQLKESLARFEREMFEIEKQYDLEMQKLNNEHEIRLKEIELIHEIIKHTKEMEVTINIYVEKEGLVSSSVMQLRADMHKERIKLIEMATAIKSN